MFLFLNNTCMNLYLRLLLITVIFLLIDFYAFQAVKKLTSHKLIWILYWGTSMAVLLNANYVMLNFSRFEGPTISTLNASGWLLMLYIPKIVIIFILFGEDLIRVIFSIWNFIYDKFFSASTDVDFFPDRRKMISQLALGIATIPFVSIIYGVIKGKYNFKVHTHEIFFTDLPEEFDGFQMTQISDVHSGSFDNADKISYAMDLINQQNSDVVFFTGDLVNNRASEMYPWIEHFKGIKAKYGKFSILGNHDYGDYIECFKILLSHDPSHWTEEVKGWNSKIDLTLAGHTHGMQFGIEIPGFKWSPVQFMYKYWAGLFEEAGRYLYVNRGFGFHAFPGRVGIWPEITVIKLRKKK